MFVSKKLTNLVAVFVTAGLMVTAAWGQAKAPAVKDQGEYDLTVALGKETDLQ